MTLTLVDTQPVHGLAPGLLVEVTQEGEAPNVVRWDSFVADNSDDDTIAWLSMATVISIGGTWRDGGGATPIWAVRRAP
jgi:hypothetical protein